MSNIKTAQKLLYTASYSDLNAIRECRARLIEKWAEAELRYSKEFQEYELNRPSKYLELKDKKREGGLKMTDQEIDRKSKLFALQDNTYIESKSYARVVLKYMDELASLQIGLMHSHKDQILHFKNK